MTKSSIMLSRPESHEYPESYKNYVSLVPDGPVLDFLTLLVGISDEAASADPEPGRWSLKQVLGHVCDTERVMSHRALRFARGDSQELRGFEQDHYVREAHSDSRTLDDLLAEFESVRQATIALFASLPPEAEYRSGLANKARVTFRALAYVAGGHAQHHYELLKASFSRQAKTAANS